MASCFKMKTKSKRETSFMKNGRALLEELVASCDGKCNPICTFSAEELRMATNNYGRDQEIVRDVDYVLYQGFLRGRRISVKRYGSPAPMVGLELTGRAVIDISIGSQTSVHKNVLKLIGCCLETEQPIVVYEYVGSETLSAYIHNHQSGNNSQLLPWKYRTKVAVQVASAVAFLHTALSRPIIHRDIRPSTIILGHDLDAKLMDFSLAISIPKGQSHAEDAVRGRMGNIAPEYLDTGLATEKVDIYLFGMLLLQLLTGKRGYWYDLHEPSGQCCFFAIYFMDDMEEKQITEIVDLVDPAILKEGIQLQELMDFGSLALSCICQEAENRPTMTDVAKELRRIHMTVRSPC